MYEGEDWLYRPILRKMCMVDVLNDIRYDLGDIVEMNEALDVEGENKARLQKWARSK